MSALKTMTRGMLGFTVTSPISLLLLGLFGISGCGNSDGSSPLITNSSVLVVEPGQGIPNVCEIGMSFAEVEMAIGEGSLHGLHDRDSFWSLKRLTQEKFVLFPTLGVIGAPEQNGRLPLLTFYVQPYDSSITSPGLVVTNPFRGRIGDRLSFSNQIARRKDVVAAFGEIRQGLTNSSQSIGQIDNTKPFFNRRETKETLYYPQDGLRFDLVNDIVQSFGVYRPEKVK